MKQLKQAGIILFVGIVIILLREYEGNQKMTQTPDIVGQAELVRIVDGDTIVVNFNGEDEKIRIIGIDTPESVKPNHPVECFGKEASEHMEELMRGVTYLHIETDPTQDTRDRNGRLLAHVFVQDLNIGKQMILEGFAYEYTYREPYIYQHDYKNAEQEAQEYERGLWSPDTCNGK